MTWAKYNRFYITEEYVLGLFYFVWADKYSTFYGLEKLPRSDQGPHLARSQDSEFKLSTKPMR